MDARYIIAGILGLIAFIVLFTSPIQIGPDDSEVIPMVFANDTYAINQTIHFSLYDHCIAWHAYVIFPNQTKVPGVDSYYMPICGIDQERYTEPYQVMLPSSFRINHEGNYTLVVDFPYTEILHDFQVIKSAESNP